MVVRSQLWRVRGQDPQTGSSPHPDGWLTPLPCRRRLRVGWEPAEPLLGGRGRAEGGGRVLGSPAALAICPAISVVPGLGVPCPASLLDADLELPLLLLDALSRGLLENLDLTSWHCPCLGGRDPLLGFWGVQTASSSQRESAEEVPCTAAFAKRGGCLC